MSKDTQDFLEVPIRHESDLGTILDLTGEKTYVITHTNQNSSLDLLSYETPLPEFMFDSAFSTADTTDYDVQTGKGLLAPVDMARADTVTSLQPVDERTTPHGGWHKPVLDIDFPAALIPSTTPGHFHLYLDKELPWDTYVTLLEALAEAGIIETGYANASIDRGHTAARLPWVKKPSTTEATAGPVPPARD